MRHRQLRLALAAATLASPLLAACGDDDPPANACDGVSGPCTVIAAGATGADLQTAFIEAQPGDTIGFTAGVYTIDRDLSLAVDRVTLRGTGTDRAGGVVLTFAGSAGAEGILITSDGTKVEHLAVEDTPGDAIKWEGADGVTVDDVRVEWTGPPRAENGSYGLYPVQCKNVLIEHSTVRGASDAGFYVGQSDNIVVRNNLARDNVAGIEIENSTNADVTQNTATTNTGGILVFNLPGLEVENGAITRVFDNQVFENNTVNFAPVGNIVALVPAGTGIAMIAAHQVEVFGNTIRDHKAVNIGVISYVPTGLEPNDPSYDQYPTAIHIHDNELTGTSDMPTGELGALLISAIGEIYPNGPYVVPDIAWDGVLDPNRTYTAADKICIQNNGDANFINLAWPLAATAIPSEDMTPHDCSLAPLPEVVFP